MRIIRIFVVLLIAISVILPQMASASETINTDTNIKSTLTLFENSSSENVSIDKIFTGKDENKTEEEIKNEAILAKWKEKQADKWENLPKDKFTINASAYTASADECGNDKGITASGIKVHKGTIACPSKFPFGTKLSIEGMGTFVCEDRGGAIKGNRIDIYMPTKKEAFQFGRQKLVAEVVSEQEQTL
jgi:3D (Asp-Asp-Asp) domain-containing protein